MKCYNVELKHLMKLRIKKKKKTRLMSFVSDTVCLTVAVQLQVFTFTQSRNKQVRRVYTTMLLFYYGVNTYRLAVL